MRMTLLALMLLAFTMAPAFAAPAKTKPPASAAPTSDKALVDKAATYLQGLKSAQASFSQTDPHGAVTSGTFSLQRPGKARFAYDPPTGLTVVADGVDVDVYDAKLKTFNQYPLKQTPLALLLASDVHFDKTAVAASVSRERGGFSITLRDAAKKTQGQLTLKFMETPFALAGWTVVDPQGGKTVVTLSNLKSGVALAADLFELRDPHPRAFKP